MFVYILIALTFTTSSRGQQYRTDYEYNRKTNAFYKLHIETENRVFAGKVCETEGAQLMTPASDLDIGQVHGMLKKYPDIGQYVWVNEDDIQHESVEEQPIIDLDSHENYRSDTLSLIQRCEVVTRTGDVKNDYCGNKLPFVCKVDAKAAYFDKTCDVFGKNYQYISNIGSCYRVSNIVYSWNEVYAECIAEGAHLVVLNSESEQQAVWNIINNVQHSRIIKESWFYFAGFRANKATADKPRVFMTIFNQTLEDAGYSEWTDNEPNNTNDNENCGSIFKNNGKLNDLNCAVPHLFICEKEIRLRRNE